jgi:hypothetical protein
VRVPTQQPPSNRYRAKYHELQPRVLALEFPLRAIGNQQDFRGRMFLRFRARRRLDRLEQSPPNTVTDARLARYPRRTQRALIQLEELSHQMMVLEVEALHLLIEAGFVLHHRKKR